MSNDPNDPRIEEYLADQLSDRERSAFESELATSRELQREMARAQLIDRALRGASRHRLGRMMDEIRTELGPLPPPRISLRDRLGWFLGRWWWLVVLLMVSFGVSWYAWSNRTCPTDAVIDSGFLEPTLIHVQAGGVTRSDLAYRASRLYGDGDSDALEKLTQESREDVPLYYLAHDYLRRNDYSRAESTFGRLLEQPATLLQFAEYQDLNALRFNQLLSRLGMSNDPEATQATLEALLARPDIEFTETETAARDLAAELASPWSWWACP